MNHLPYRVLLIIERRRLAVSERYHQLRNVLGRSA